MKLFGCFLLLTFIVSISKSDDDQQQLESIDYETPQLQTKEIVKGSDLAKKFIEHFQNPEAKNMPLPIPDPLVMPDRVYQVIFTRIHTTNVLAFGVSRVRVHNFTSNAVDMTVHFGLRMPLLTFIGNYTVSDGNSGVFNVTLVNAYSDCKGKLQVTRDGELEAAEIVMDLVSQEKLEIKMENGGFIGMLVNTFGDLLFNSMKNYFLPIISNNIRSNVNMNLKKFKVMFPNSIAPIDLAIAEGRKFFKNFGFDPYHIPDYQYATSIYSVDITDIILTGLSSFYRIGDLKMLLDNHIVHMIVNVGTEELQGNCNWEAGIAGLLTKAGSSSFTIDYINVMISVNQSLDIRKRPQVIDLSIKLGNIQLRMDGAGMWDYVAEMGVNVLPNLVRYQIIQAAEKPIRRKIQEEMDNMDVEKMVMERLHLLDKELNPNDNSIKVLKDSFGEDGVQSEKNEDEQDLIPVL